jgi:hypothetical protein
VAASFFTGPPLMACENSSDASTQQRCRESVSHAMGHWSPQDARGVDRHAVPDSFFRWGYSISRLSAPQQV